MADRTVARRYARAFVDLATETNSVDALGQDLERLSAAMNSGDGALFHAMTNPVFTTTERKKVLEAVLPRLGMNALTNNLARLLVDNERMGALPDIIELYRQAADEHAGRVRVRVSTASPLDDAMREQVTNALASATGKHVILETEVDPDLIGGIVARVGGKVYDASLRTRLHDLKNRLVRAQNPAEA